MTEDNARRSRPWFAVKSHGYGSGLPISWQGWACLAGFIGISIVLGQVIAPAPAVAAIGLLAIGFVVLAKRKSDAPWRWRSGAGE